MTERPAAKRILLWTVAALTALGAASFAWVWFAPCWLGGCAPLDDLAEYQAEGSQLLDINGQQFATLATVNRRIVSIDSLPAHLPQAFTSVEDRRFYDHGGVDFRRLVGAMISNVRAGGVEEGGSTITQQLARNLFPEWLPYTDRSVRRKVMEARVARQIERQFTKDKILELYLNHIYLGNGAYGVEAASQAYFGKSAADVDLTEAALLAGLPASPSRLDPTRNPEGALERRNLVLQRMATAGVIAQADADNAAAEPLELNPERDADQDGPASSYFVEAVRQEIEEIVGTRIYSAGLQIHTTLDLAYQTAAEEELLQQLAAIEAGQFGTYRHPSYAAYSDSAGGPTEYLQGAFVLLEAGSGEVRALVGGRDFEHSRFNRATQALRQAGSAFKPFVFLEAIRRYGSPARIVEDAPVRIQLTGSRVWEPRNYTGSYDGPIPLRDALARSKNSVAAQIGQEVGVDAVARTAHELGINSEIPRLPAMALGAADVRPIELVSAYAPFTNGGRRVEPHFIRRIVDRHGRTVWSASPASGQVVDPAAAFILTSMLRDVVDRGTGTAVRATGFRLPAAGKTGTTNDAADVWFVGYTPDLVGGVWMGLDRRATIVRGASGGTLAAPVWGRVMRRVYADRPTPDEWPAPSSVATAQVIRGTGEVENPECPSGLDTYTEFFLHSPPPPRFCDAPGPMYTWYGDTLWGDEEWNTGMPLDSTFESDGTVDWPELEELRRRLGAAGDTTLAGLRGDSLYPARPGDPLADSLATLPADPALLPGTEDEDGDGEADGDGVEEQVDERGPPRILGEPVQREDNGAAPASPAPGDP